MSTAAQAKVAMVLRNAASAGSAHPDQPPGSALAEFEQLYLANADAVMAYFSRRCREPQVVADLTSETFVRAAAGFGGFDSNRGSPRAWVFGIATHVFAWHCQQSANGRRATARLASHRQLAGDEIEELAGRIDAEREGRRLIERFGSLPATEREAVELVDLEDLTPKEAAAALGVSSVVLRKRLSRARSRLRKEPDTDE